MVRLEDFPAAEKALIGGGAAVAGMLKFSLIETYLAIGIGAATFILVLLRCLKVLVEIRQMRQSRRD